MPPKINLITPKKSTLKSLYCQLNFWRIFGLIILALFIISLVLLRKNQFTKPIITPNQKNETNFTEINDSPADLSGPKAPDASQITAVPLPAGTNIFGTFFDTFSGEGFFDAAKTSLYQDKKATAFFFSPDYNFVPATSLPKGQELVNAHKTYFNSLSYNSFDGPYHDKYCLGSNCLEQTGNNLFYNGKSVPWPKEVAGARIAALSIGALDKTWLVGFTLKDGTNYRGLVFSFDGRSFKQLKLNEIKSSYFGLFGFGGKENDFLVIYGARQGIAYQIKNGVASDISQFFDIRAMDSKGFKAMVLRATIGQNINWYVFSLTTGTPWLIKLWQRDGEAIIGEVVLDHLFGDGNRAGFRLVKTEKDRITLLTQVRNSNNLENYYVFTDYGFKNETAAVLTFNPVSPDPSGQNFNLKKIAESRLDLDRLSVGKVKLSFSSDGERYAEAPLGKNLTFDYPALKNFFLRVSFPAEKDKFYSPFLAEILFDYYYQR